MYRTKGETFTQIFLEPPRRRVLTSRAGSRRIQTSIGPRAAHYATTYRITDIVERPSGDFEATCRVVRAGWVVSD